mmetsp:Transcript_80576/g.261103  ORF Transcript_80576/g.261103 Transcript_80576/m.261103 type:complete len:206 (+) Transcript_80576:974-1591(+)
MARRRASAMANFSWGTFANEPRCCKMSCHHRRCSSSRRTSLSRSTSIQTAVGGTSSRKGTSVSAVLELEKERKHSSSSGKEGAVEHRRRGGDGHRDCGGVAAGDGSKEALGDEDVEEGPLDNCQGGDAKLKAGEAGPEPAPPAAASASEADRCRPTLEARCEAAAPRDSQCVAAKSPKAAWRSKRRKRVLPTAPWWLEMWMPLKE